MDKTKLYEIYVEEMPDMDYVILHCEVYHWSKSVLLDMKITLDAVREVWYDKIIYAPTVDSKQNKFLKLLGFEWRGDVALSTALHVEAFWRLPRWEALPQS